MSFEIVKLVLQAGRRGNTTHVQIVLSDKS